ncbi:hypothetical protein DSO57_1034384 [Entomophthora muscae]|uniref:Uncharacterized protein n=1 Tax=Entomophthora muscae TaxID=34485 RepID=A0ACC2S1S1_9FUNG|nr:hypothetical protein DSO57_1034384 [Entomophthora muscae]
MSYNPNSTNQPDQSRSHDERTQQNENINLKHAYPSSSGTAGPAQPARKQSRSSGSNSVHKTGGQSGLRGQQAFVINPKKRALEHKTQTGGGFESNSLPTGVQDPSALAYQITSELNERLDIDIDSLIGSFSDIIKCSKVQDKDKYRIQQEQYQIECRAANLVRSCESILTLIAEMKQSLLLNDTTMFHPQPLKHPDPGAFVSLNADPKNTPIAPGTEGAQDSQEAEAVHPENEFFTTLTNLHPVGRIKLDSLKSLYPNNKLP